MMMGRSKSELFLLLLAFLMVGLGIYGLTHDLGLRRYLFSLTDDSSAMMVGKVAGLTGGTTLRRQRSDRIEFASIPEKSDLFNGDTVVTDDATNAVLEFQDGSRMELGPSSMVQLIFETHYGWDGIQRLWDVKVVQGSVTARAAGVPMRLNSPKKTIDLTSTSPAKLEVASVTAPQAPSAPVAPPEPIPAEPVAPKPIPPKPVPPKPISAKVEILSPTPGSILKVPVQATVRKLNVQFQAKVAGVQDKSLLIRAVESSKGTKVFEKAVAVRAGDGLISADWTAKRPGSYRWQILTLAGAPVRVAGKAIDSAFQISPWIESIEILDPLIAGKILSSNQIQGDLVQNFSVTLRWKSSIPAKAFQLWFGSREDSKQALLQKTVNRSEYTFNKDKLFAGSVFYRVTADVGEGWAVTSGLRKFAFNFLPPILVVPPPGTQFTLDAADTDATVLFTWQKTNFTEGYELQVSADPTFAKPLLTKQLRDNLHVMLAPNSGHYYWRVRAYSKSVSSSFGKPNEFDVKR